MFVLFNLTERRKKFRALEKISFNLPMVYKGDDGLLFRKFNVFSVKYKMFSALKLILTVNIT